MKFIRILLVCLLVITLASCGNSNEEVSSEKMIIKFTDAGWDSMKLNNEIAGYIIENGFGYDTDTIPGSSAATWLGQKKGEISVNMETWSDNIPDYDETIKSGEIVELGMNMEDNKQGIYVPTYLIKGDEKRGIEPMAPDLKNVKDLPKYKDLFKDPEEPSKGRLYNAPATWIVSQTIETKHKLYGLKDTYTLFAPGSDTSLATSLASAYEKGEPWVGYYWEPTWISGKYDLTLLKENKYSDELWNDNYNCEFKPTKVTITVHKDMMEKTPEVIGLFKKYKLSSKDIAKALAYMQENDESIENTAIWFLKENEEIWTKWIDEDTKNKVQEKLKDM
ncbi:MAG: ABC transporter substrate-binding protein [Anaeromicrobium sp.]|jgi:glycine betaine/proline transport system substrate-binding protein|uniref:ABC transporter substrate-binding protein n=1 Tax=Anaeromicrobium sp. TaxID=1929132 RepID=UPI0025D2A3AA|nr:ABC transporter substrate-binding protein [Anaeromicrobium sp.]MCT4596124.1 ABC transporter substrate-binding protein [Anaeromicrobium sp.]